MPKIVILGDSLVDTLFFGGNFWDLKLLLDKNYPNQPFEIFNYGVGSTNAENGLFRINNPYDYKDKNRHMEPLTSLEPDYVVVGDFAYNHWTDSPEDLAKYKATILNIIQELQAKTKAKIILYHSMCPNKNSYVTGIPWLGWSEEKRLQEYATTRLYQKVFSEIAQSSGLPAIDCLTPTTLDNDGDPQYISNVDFIHPSAAMRKLVAEKLIDLLNSH